MTRACAVVRVSGHGLSRHCSLEYFLQRGLNKYAKFIVSAYESKTFSNTANKINEEQMSASNFGGSALKTEREILTRRLHPIYTQPPDRDGD